LNRLLQGGPQDEVLADGLNPPPWRRFFSTLPNLWRAAVGGRRLAETLLQHRIQWPLAQWAVDQKPAGEWLRSVL